MSILGNERYRRIKMATAVGIFENDSKIKLIDVRTPEEFAGGHIPNSINVPLDRISDISAHASKDDRLFVFCRSGVRSITACDALVNLGYTDITEIGGVLDWTGKVIVGN